MLHEIDNKNFFSFASASEAASALADRICTCVSSKPNCVLGLATGATMEPVYRALIDAHHAGLTFSGVMTFNLDEYVGLPHAHPSSYRSTMDRLFFDHVDIAPQNRHLPDGMCDDPQAEARAYERAIGAAGGIDFQILGLGRNGHIGFNEPGAGAQTRTRVVDLHPDTLQANRPFFAATEESPSTAITVGVATIMDARHIAVLATGAHKSKPLKAALEGPVSAHCPASFLQNHGSTEWLVDAAALEGNIR